MSEAVVSAVGIALSPFSFIPAVLLLFTARPRATAGSFVLGWFAGVAVVTALAVLLADVLALPPHSPRWVSWVRVVLGLVLVVVGLRDLLRRSTDASPPRWLTAFDDADPRSAARLGLLAAAVNPKIVLLAAAGGFSLEGAVQGRGAQAAAVLAFAALASLAAALPVVWYLLRGARALGPLGRAKDWLATNSAVVMGVVLLLIGLLVGWKGVGGLR